jgi:hypothetical protein
VISIFSKNAETPDRWPTQATIMRQQSVRHGTTRPTWAPTYLEDVCVEGKRLDIHLAAEIQLLGLLPQKLVMLQSDTLLQYLSGIKL